MSTSLALTKAHTPVFDEDCKICAHGKKDLLEKWYLERRPMTELSRLFQVSEGEIEDHAKACKLSKRRANNTAAIINLIAERGLEKLRNGELEMTMKDLCWAVNHKDRILGRITEKVQHDIPPVVIVHTTVPGVGGIADSDVKAMKAATVREALPSGKDVILAEFEEVLPQSTSHAEPVTQEKAPNV